MTVKPGRHPGKACEQRTPGSRAARRLLNRGAVRVGLKLVKVVQVDSTSLNQNNNIYFPASLLLTRRLVQGPQFWNCNGKRKTGATNCNQLHLIALHCTQLQLLHQKKICTDKTLRSPVQRILRAPVQKWYFSVRDPRGVKTRHWHSTTSIHNFRYVPFPGSLCFLGCVLFKLLRPEYKSRHSRTISGLPPGRAAPESHISVTHHPSRITHHVSRIAVPDHACLDPILLV